MFRRLIRGALLFCFLFASGELPAEASAYRYYLRDCLSFSAAAGVTGFYLLPRDIQAIVSTADVLEDLVQAYYDCDTHMDAWLDPNYFQTKVRGEPRFILSLKDERGWGTITNHLLASLRIYDVSRDRFVHYLNAWSGWSVSDIRLVVEVEDGGIYDMDGVVNGSVDVGWPSAQGSWTTTSRAPRRSAAEDVRPPGRCRSGACSRSCPSSSRDRFSVEDDHSAGPVAKLVAKVSLGENVMRRPDVVEQHFPVASRRDGHRDVKTFRQDETQRSGVFSFEIFDAETAIEHICETVDVFRRDRRVQDVFVVRVDDGLHQVIGDLLEVVSAKRAVDDAEVHDGDAIVHPGDFQVADGGLNLRRGIGNRAKAHHLVSVEESQRATVTAQRLGNGVFGGEERFVADFFGDSAVEDCGLGMILRTEVAYGAGNRFDESGPSSSQDIAFRRV